MKFGFQVLLGLAAICYPLATHACSTCLCGDPTLTIMGNEKPFSGRSRVSADFRYRTEDFGTPNVNEQSLTESRFSISGAYTPWERLSLSLSIPFVSKELTFINGGKESAFGLGDIELKSKLYLSSSIRASKHLYGILAGMKIPSAPYAKNDSGQPVNFDAQPGNGAWNGMGGAWYNFFNHPWSFYTSLTAQFSTEGHQNIQPGNALLNTLHLQYQTGYHFALQFGVDSLLSTNDTDVGVKDPNSGGFLTMLSPAIVWSPITDWLLNLTVQIPTIDRLNGEHDQGINIFTGVTYDFSM